MNRTFLLLLATALFTGPGPAVADDKAKEKIETKKKADAEAKMRAEAQAKQKAATEAKKNDDRARGAADKGDGQQKPVTQIHEAKPGAPAATTTVAKPGTPPAGVAPAPTAPAGKPASAKPATPAAADASAPSPAGGHSAPAPAEATPAKPAGPASDTAQATAAATATRSAPPTPGVLHLSGRWSSKAGTVYDITQSGSTFRWTVVKGRGHDQQIGAGTIQGTAVEASWTAPFAGASNGTVTVGNGRAIRIQWRNGAVFIRDLATDRSALAAPTDPRILQLAGRWNSNAGTVYDITQSGEAFTWVVVQGRGQNEQVGAGTVKGTEIEASWSAPFGGAANGIITTDGGRAIRIRWRNGAVFIR